MQRSLIVLPMVLFMLAAPVRAQEAGVQERSAVGAALHKCMFNKPCNWTGHATIGAGIVFGLHKLNVKAEYAAVASALVWVGKELRDEAKWGNVLGTTDSTGDLLSGLAGAYLAYRIIRAHDRQPPLLTLNRDADGATTVRVRLKTR